MELSTVGAAVASGLLSGGGAGYLVSVYTARKESEDRKQALELEREKFKHQQRQDEIERSQDYDASRLDLLRRVQAAFRLINDIVGDMYSHEDVDSPTATKPMVEAWIARKDRFIESHSEIMQLMHELMIYRHWALARRLGALRTAASRMTTASDKPSFTEAKTDYENALAIGYAELGLALRNEPPLPKDYELDNSARAESHTLVTGSKEDTE